MQDHPTLLDWYQHTRLRFVTSWRLIAGPVREHVKWSVLTIMAAVLLALFLWSSWKSDREDIAKAAEIAAIVLAAILLWGFICAPVAIWRQQENRIADMRRRITPSTEMANTLSELRAIRIGRRRYYSRDCIWVLRAMAEPGPHGMTLELLHALSLSEETRRHAIAAGGASIGAREMHVKPDEFDGLLQPLIARGLVECSVGSTGVRGFGITDAGLVVWRWSRIEELFEEPKSHAETRSSTPE